MRAVFLEYGGVRRKDSVWQHSDVFGRSQDLRWRWEWPFAALRGIGGSLHCVVVGAVTLSSMSAVASCCAASWGGAHDSVGVEWEGLCVLRWGQDKA